MYLLDTNIVSYLQAGRTSVAQKVTTKEAGEIAICGPVLAELYFGAYLNPIKEKILIEKYQQVERICQVYDFGSLEAKTFAKLKAELTITGRIIEDFDLMIASICLANDLILVTHNLKHFKNISGLKVEDWVVE
ncbi:MAG: type II toxin-antitoxin system VapC family toxin [bacterium]